MKKNREVIEWCLNSLATEPFEWVPYQIGGKLYDLKHRNGVRVWLANGYSGLHVDCDGYEIGGVTGWSAFFGALIPWRRRLRAAAVAAAREQGAGLTAAEAILNRIAAGA